MEGCKMKAMSWRDYGAIDQIRIIDVATPIPKANEVRLRTHASSINSWDWEIIQGTPWVNRVEHRLTSNFRIIGADVAGVVEAVGRAVTRFKAGDEVYGDLSGCHWGGFAEYVTADAEALFPKPTNLSFAQAAAVPQAGLLALQGLRDKGALKKGEKVLINGASGGVGTFAVQLAKQMGGEITAVCSGRKIDLVKSLGADHVIDYKQDDFTQSGQLYDLILDNQGRHSVSDYQKVLSPNGRYVMVGGDSSLIYGMLWRSIRTAIFGGPQMGLLLHKANKGLDELTLLLQQGCINPVIDRCYPLAELQQAMRYYAEGNARGKVVITTAQESP
jgi:NADPH:quinone reductase-like Zn-dependent oxidoreductase